MCDEVAAARRSFVTLAFAELGDGGLKANLRMAFFLAHVVAFQAAEAGWTFNPGRVTSFRDLGLRVVAFQAARCAKSA